MELDMMYSNVPSRMTSKYTFSRVEPPIKYQVWTFLSKALLLALLVIFSVAIFMDHIRKLVFDRLPYYMISGLLSYHQIILKGQIRMDELIDYAWYNGTWPR